jgi:hypothetical protein
LLLAMLFVVVLVALSFSTRPATQPYSKTADLLTKIAFAVLVTVVVRSLSLALDALKEPDHSATFAKLGMLRVCDPLGDEELQRRLAGSRKIRVLKTWFPETTTIERGLELAIKRHRAKVRLLLAHPDSQVLAQRSGGAGESPSHGAMMVLRTLNQVVDWIGHSRDADVQIGLYDSWPGCPVIWCDDTVLMGFYFRGRSSPHWPWVEVEAGSKLDKEILKSQFDSLWSHRDTIRLSTVAEIASWLAQRKSPAPAPPAPGEKEERKGET